MSYNVSKPSVIRPPALCWAALLICLSSAPAQAQDWRFEPRLAVGGETDDNAQLTTRTDDVVRLEGYLLAASADISYQSESAKFLFAPLIMDRSYPNDKIFDSTMYDARLRYDYRMPRQRWRIDVWFNEDDIRNGERADINLDEDDPENIPDDDTGLVQLKGERTRLSVRPSWVYNWSDTSSTVLRVNYRDVSYDTELLLNDYTDAIITADYRMKFSDRHAGFVSGSVRTYDVAEDQGEFDSKAINVGFETLLSEKVRMRFRIGAEDVESSVSGLNETRPIGELTFTRRLETIRFLAQYRRSVTASGQGRMSERDAINLAITRVLNQRFEAGLGLRTYRSDPIQLAPNDPTFGRNYAQLTARLVWNMTRSFAMQTMYRYTWVDREILGESANSNHIMLWFVFQPSGPRDEDLL